MSDPRLPVTVPNFERRVYCILGLPFDAHDMASAQRELLSAIAAGRRYVMVTPNVNFLAACQRDSTFRDALLKSDVSLADGAPIVALARLGGLPIVQRVSGSGLFAALRAGPVSRRISTFLFGESLGIAKQAGDRLNQEQGGVRCAGWYEPEYGSAEALSTTRIRNAINSAGADFLVVALGAQKGQRWIDRNVGELNTPAICHLGAVIKMTAGTVRRAPPMVRRLGLEWLWRIREEPALWKRYRDDAMIFARLIAQRAIPMAIHRLSTRVLGQPGRPAQLRVNEGDAVVRIKMSGDWTVRDSDILRSEFADIAETGKDLELDLGELTDIDSGVTGLLLLLRGHALRAGLSMNVLGVSWNARRLLGYFCADYLIDPVVSVRPIPARVPAAAASAEVTTPADASDRAESVR